MLLISGLLNVILGRKQNPDTELTGRAQSGHGGFCVNLDVIGQLLYYLSINISVTIVKAVSFYLT